jgi:glutathione S-transferase
MPHPILYYTPGTCALAELIVLEWIGEPYQVCRVEREARQSPAFLKLNPHGAVPVLQVGQRVLTENGALLLHLADATPRAGLVPKVGTPERDEVHYWLSYLASRYHVAHYPIFKTQKYSDRPELHEHLRAMGVARVTEELRFLDGVFAQRRFAVGDRHGIVDAYFSATGRWGRKFVDYGAVCPQFERYLRSLEDDPAVQRALATEAGRRNGPDGALLGHVPLPQ